MLLLASCSDEQQYQDIDGDGGKVTLSCSVSIPSTSTAETRAMGDMTAAKSKDLDLWLVVFDSEGFLVESAQAYEQASTGDNTTFRTTFAVQLSRSTKKRIIHFVAVDFTNAPITFTKTDWDEKMAALPYGHQTEVIRNLTVPHPVDAYWQTTAVNTIHEDTKFTDIPLIRNFAKVEITSKASDFVLEGFAICHAPDKGTVAPYNSSIGEFVDYIKSGATSKDYTDLSGYHGIIPADAGYQNTPEGDGDGGLTFNKDEKFLYEIPNSEGNTKGQTYIIVKGKYNGGNSSYYKVDFVKRGTEGMEYYDILRNIFYSGEIQSVTADGYASAYLASQAAASNNISASTTTSGIPNISDGQQRIFVSSTLVVITKNEPVTMKYKYIPDITSGVTYGNGEVQYNKTLDFATQDDNGSDDSDGWRTLTITPNGNPPSGGSIKSGTIHFYVNTGVETDEILTRDVQVVYREPFSLAVTCPAEVAKTTGTAVTVTLQISKDFYEKMFPLTFYVEPSPKTLYPDASRNSLPVHLGKSLAGGNTNSFSYEKTITWEEYQVLNAPTGTNYKELPCYFLTNCAESAATVYAYNEYCGNAVNCSFVNKEPVLNSVTLSGAQYYGTGRTATLDIDAADATKELEITIAEVGGGTTTIPWVSGQTSYTYTTRTFGGKISATVSVKNDTESISVSQTRNTLKQPQFTATGDGLSRDYSYGQGWRTYSYSASNQSVTIMNSSGTTIGSGTISTTGFVSDVVIEGLTSENDTITLQYSFTPTYTSWGWGGQQTETGTTQTRSVNTTVSALTSGTATLNFSN